MWAATFFTGAVLFHGADHVRRGVDATGRDVFWVGTAAVVLEVAIVVLACQRHRLAPVAAVAGGFGLAFGYVFVHFLPGRSWLSDSFVSAAQVSPLSWVAAALEVVAALTVGVVGLVVLRERGGLASAATERAAELPLSRALVHPTVVAMLVGNAAIVAVSFAQL